MPQREYPSDDEACAEGALDGREYRSAARVLLLGMGADEQMGGYGRHRTAYRKGGAEALRRELAADCERMWLRNLGRDDRVLSDWGREPRFPSSTRASHRSSRALCRCRSSASSSASPAPATRRCSAAPRARSASARAPRAAEARDPIWHAHRQSTE